jgi:ABC-2 type transport system ATP-binding protein
VNIELVKDIILEKKKEGISIIFSTHLMAYAEKIVDDVVMINKGKKVIDGNLSDVKARYGTKFVKVNYEGDSGFVHALDYVQSVKDYGNEMEIELNDIGLKNKLLNDLVTKISVNGFQVTEPSLNNIFIRKVNEGEGK